MKRWTAPILALGMTGLAPVAAQAQEVAVVAMAIEGTRLDIVATGESRRVPDVAEINAGVATEAATAQAALADNNARMRTIFAALDRAGIARRDIQTAQINLNARYDYGEGREPRLIGYTATNSLTVTFRDIERAGPIIDTLVAQGINQINGPSLRVDEPEAALDEARRDAIAKARQRAELYASALGMRVVRIIAVSESGAGQPPVIMARQRMMAADQAESLEIAPGEQRLTANVSVSFELQ